MKTFMPCLFFVSAISYATSLRDVQPTDAEYLQLTSLSERYDCLTQYPASVVSILRANRPMSRYEFAALINSCAIRVEELFSTVPKDMTLTSDLNTLNKLKILFQHELSTLSGDVE